jgi:hypothetical protein
MASLQAPMNKILSSCLKRKAVNQLLARTYESYIDIPLPEQLAFLLRDIDETDSAGERSSPSRVLRCTVWSW